MYLSMLKSAVNNLKGIKTEVTIDSEINFNDRALLPDTYMPVANERLKIYRSLNDAKSTKDIHRIFEEIKDRCGKPSDDVLNLVENSKIRVLRLLEAFDGWRRSEIKEIRNFPGTCTE